MKAQRMSCEAVMAQLEAWASESARKIYARQGAGDNQFGVKLGDLRGLAKKLKTDHALGMQLWATGNADARILATMLMASDHLSEQEVACLVQPLTYFRLIDELTENVISKTSFADVLRERWLESPEEFVGRAGWMLLIAKILDRDTDGLDFDAILETIAAEILSAPRRKQEAMNRCLCEIGIRYPDYTQKCLDLGERLGRFDDRPVPKGCTSSYAPEWIAAGLQRRR